MVNEDMNKEKENKISGYSTMQIVLDLVGIFVFIVGLFAGYGILSIGSNVPSNIINGIPGNFYMYLGLVVISIGFFAGFSLWGIAHLRK